MLLLFIGPIVHLGSMIGSAMTKTGSIEVAVRKIRKEKPILSRLLGCSDNSQKSKSNCCRHNDFTSNIIFHLSHFRNDLERRNFISIGAGAGEFCLCIATFCTSLFYESILHLLSLFKFQQ